MPLYTIVNTPEESVNGKKVNIAKFDFSKVMDPMYAAVGQDFFNSVYKTVTVNKVSDDGKAKVQTFNTLGALDMDIVGGGAAGCRMDHHGAGPHGYFG